MKINMTCLNESDFNTFITMPVIDCHTHVREVGGISKLADIMNTYNINKINVLSLASGGDIWMAQNPMCLLFKALYPGKVYAFGSLNYPSEGAPKDGQNLVEQVKRLMKSGFDGIKMIEGKPDMRKRIGIPLNAPVYNRYYEYMEAQGIPLLYHVADPGVFWDKDKITEEAIKQNWAYLDPSFQSKATLYGEIDSVLEKFPHLKIIFAHFYFMDEEGIERASNFLDKWPNVSFDITPGMMYYNFTQKLDEWRKFFIKYQDRILFGTDNDYGESRELIYTIRTVLETDNEIEYWNWEIKGMHLSAGVLEKLYYKNYEQYVGTAPKDVNPESILEECNHVICLAQGSPMSEKILQDIKDIKEVQSKLL